MTLRHSNIIQFYHHWDSVHVMYFAERGALAANISSIGDLKEDIARQISSGLVYLHGLGYIHKKINTSNILLTQNFEAKIAGFGSESGAVRSAPELANALWPFSERTDIFDLGQVLKELGEGSEAYMSWMNMCCSPNPEERPLTCPLTPLDFFRPTSRSPDIFKHSFGANFTVDSYTLSSALQTAGATVAVHDGICSSTTETPTPAVAVSGLTHSATIDIPALNFAADGLIRSSTLNTSGRNYRVNGRTRTRSSTPGIYSAANGSNQSSTPYTAGMNLAASRRNHSSTTGTPDTERKTLHEVAKRKEDVATVRGWLWSDDSDPKIPVGVENAEEYLLHLAGTGEPLAQYNVGKYFYYQYNRSCCLYKKDLETAEHWLLKSAAQAFKPAWHDLGKLYYGQQRFNEAKEYLLKIAPNGNKEAQLYLAEAYYYGIDWRGDRASRAEDECQARGWYNRAESQGCAHSKYSLGYMSHHGIGTIRDRSEAQKWYHSAANLGHPHAEEMLRVLRL
ncbi:hypothetical protein BGZ68_002444 [Mortierella alpina]|nr:hypothetical protein BGZ68_002444 [Mortierella alpina]